MKWPREVQDQKQRTTNQQDQEQRQRTSEQARLWTAASIIVSRVWIGSGLLTIGVQSLNARFSAKNWRTICCPACTNCLISFSFCAICLLERHLKAVLSIDWMVSGGVLSRTGLPADVVDILAGSACFRRRLSWTDLKKQ